MPHEFEIVVPPGKKRERLDVFLTHHVENATRNKVQHAIDAGAVLVNLPASIHQRLLNKARQSGRAFNELIQYYAIERLLYRLSISGYSELFTLKGALMFHAWGFTNTRPTRDIDLLGHTQNTVDSVLKIFRDVSKLEPEPDGLDFDPHHIHGEIIKDDAKYEGIQIIMPARLGRTRLNIQIDIGFADVITPAPEKLENPSILDLPAPSLFGYPAETVIAEKFQAMTVLGMVNRRMKDFYDIWMLITNLEFDGIVIQTAIERTFQNRGTELPTEKNIIFSDEFVENKMAQWNAFSRKEKGQKSRSGYSRRLGFEGGQMPLYRRVPKRGFTNIFKTEFAVLNVADLERVFDAGTVVDAAALRSAGLVKGRKKIKVLGNGDLSKKFTVHADKFSATARTKIEAAGGTCQEIQ